MSDTTKAVFLSYASQDAQAARRICEALRASGVEVWFDQNELVGGDAWDAKIRKQIAECALFVPVISANTQARLEGYFRIEWKLAAQRTHAMAEAKPFLLPVVIDAMRDAEAHVPTEFRVVQWTRLPAGETTALFCARVRALLDGGAAMPRPPAVSNHGRDTSGGPLDESPARNHRRRLGLPVALAGVAVIALGVAIWQSGRRGLTESSPPQESGSGQALANGRSAEIPAAAGARKSGAVQPDVASLMARARALSRKIDVVRADLDAASALIDQAVKLDPTNAEAWATRALVDWRYADSYLDRSPARFDAVRQHARQAMSIDPTNATAQFAQALALVLLNGNAPTREAAVKMLEPLAESPDVDVDVLLSLSLLERSNLDKARAYLDRAARVPAAAGRANFNRAMMHFRARQFQAAEDAIDRAIADDPAALFLLWKAYLQQIWEGDPATAVRTIAAIPPALLLDDFAMSARYSFQLCARDYDGALATMRAFPRDYIESGASSGPTGYFKGYVLARAGKTAAAEIEWRAALDVVERRLAPRPNDRTLLVFKALLLASLGDRPGAEKLWRAARELFGDAGEDWADHRLRLELLPDDEALDYLATQIERGQVWALAGFLRVDPYLDRLRANPRFSKLLAQADADPRLSPHAAKPATKLLNEASPALDPKSVAVLAFDNLSDDKANEYFSDGISEELLNALAKVPGLRVAARTSAFYFKGRHETAQEIGQKLGMAHLVDGTVRKEGNAVRVVAHLSRTDTGEQIWTAAFDGTLDKPWALQEKIAGQIAQALQVKLGATAQAARSVNPEAYAFVLEGRYFWNQRADQPEDALAKAADAFQRALTLDPDFAEAHAGLGDVWVTRGLYRSMDGRGASVAGDYAQAKAEARRALALNPALAEPHVTLGYVAYCERQFADAEQHYARAFAANPNYALAYHWHAILLSAVGRVDEDLQELDRSIRLDPLSSNTLWSLTVSCLNRGRLAEALAASDRALALRPGLVPAHSDRALILLKLGRKDEAITEARTVGRDLTVEPRWWADAGAIYVLRQAGLAAEAADYAKRVLAIFSADDYRRAFVLAALGRFDEALPAMRAIPTIALTRVYWHPMWDPFRDDPRFRQLLVRLGCADEYKVAREARARTIGQRKPEAKQ
jgi:TolB-like protein/Flp pilus assembly protein TadD